MSDLISTLASQSGLDTDKAKNGLGALLSTVKEHTSGDVFSKISAEIPDAGNLVSSFQSAASSSQTSAGSGIAGIAGSMLGGKGEAATTLITQFSKVGFSLESLKGFLPVALGLLKDKLSPDTMKQVESAIPGLGNLVGGSDASGVLGKIKNMF